MTTVPQHLDGYLLSASPSMGRSQAQVKSQEASRTIMYLS